MRENPIYTVTPPDMLLPENGPVITILSSNKDFVLDVEYLYENIFKTVPITLYHPDGVIDDTNSAITNNTTTVTMAKFFTPTLNTSTNYKINFANNFYNPHSEHNKSGGGILASTGFQIDGDTSTEYFFDEDGDGALRIYSVVSGTRTYLSSSAGTIDYTNGVVNINAVKITAVSNVDGATSTQIRVTAIPSSNDVVPVRNQILEIDLVNSTVTGQIDNTATTGVGYTTTTSGTASTTSVNTTTSYPTSSGY